MNIITEQDAVAFDTDVLTIWSEMFGRTCQSDLFFIPMRDGGFGVASAVHRRAAAPWTAWRAVMPQLVEHAGVTDIATLLQMCPKLAGQLAECQRQLAEQTDRYGYANKTLDAALKQK